MKTLPDDVRKAWNDRKGPAIFVTVDDNRMPNAIYVTCVNLESDHSIVIADNYFDKTRKNIQAGSPGSVLFMTNAGKTYQVKGPVAYQTEGAVFDNMKKWNPEKHPGHAAVVVACAEVYSGAEKIL